jgi:DNA-binding NarL/FixJ family response regulator
MSSVKSPHIFIAILDDHQIVIDGLKLLLNDHEGIEIVAEANTASEILSQINNKHIDILLTDITMPSSAMDGYELSMKIRREFPDMKILALSMNESGAIISKMIDDAAVNGYISKAGGKDELIHAIEAIAKGEYFFLIL